MPVLRLWPALLGAAAALLAGAAQAEPPRPLPDNVVEGIRKRIAARHGYPGRCTKVTYPGWDGVRLRSCDYEVLGMRATVILANASPRRIARWLVRACIEIDVDAIPFCAERLRRHVERAGFYQFPVAGVVIEDLDGNKPGPEAYAFRNGVTVRVDGLVNGTNQQPDPAQMRAALHGEVREAMVFARLASTTREQYRAHGGRADVGGSAPGQRKVAWVDVVGELYRRALKSDDNELIIAWAKANRGRLSRE